MPSVLGFASSNEKHARLRRHGLLPSAHELSWYIIESPLIYLPASSNIPMFFFSCSPGHLLCVLAPKDNEMLPWSSPPPSSIKFPGNDLATLVPSYLVLLGSRYENTNWRFHLDNEVRSGEIAS